jgi:diacylglycerol kinase family enzyme
MDLAPLSPAQIARRLNAHHAQHCAGFYPSTGGRAFLARVRSGRLEVSYDFQTFRQVDHAAVTFNDHNGRPISMK